MPLILIIRNEHKMAFSPLKIIPLPAQNCLFTVQNWLTNFHVSQSKYWSPRLVQLKKCLMFDDHFLVIMICLLLEAKCDLLEAKNVLKSIFNISFQAQLCDIGNVSSLGSHENICWTAEGNVICDFEKYANLELHFIALVAWNTSRQIATKITREQNQVKVMCHNFGHLLTRVPLWTICDSDVRENEKSFGQFGNRPKTFAAVSRQICQNDIFQFQIIFYAIFQVYDRGRGIYWMKGGLLDI